MNAGELINKLGEVPPETPVEMLSECDDCYYCTDESVTNCEYDEERGVVVLS